MKSFIAKPEKNIAEIHLTLMYTLHLLMVWYHLAQGPTHAYVRGTIILLVYSIIYKHG